MAATSVKANLYGPLFSFLLYDNVRCMGDQEGFLLGTISSHQTDSVNDAQMNTRTEETIIDIHSVVACDTTYSFYNNCGDVTPELLNSAIGNKYDNIIGWYRFRRNTNLEPLFLERVIHQNLVNYFVEKKEFLFGIFTSSFNANISTHSFDHAFLKLDYGSNFDLVPLTIINLGDGSQKDYKVHHPSPMDNRLIDDSELPNTGHVIQKIQSSLQFSLKDLCQQVSESEEKVYQAQREVELLRTQLQISRAMAESPETALSFTQFSSTGTIKDSSAGIEISEHNDSTSINYLRDNAEMLSERDEGENSPVF